MKDLAVRLYKNHDLDLIALYKNKTFSFKYYFIKTLENTCEGKSIAIPYPQEEEKIDTLKVNSLMFRVEISDEVYDWLKEIPFGYQNQFVKNIFRSSFNQLLTNAYFEGNKQSIEKNINVTKPEKKEAQNISQKSPESSITKDKIIEPKKEEDLFKQKKSLNAKEESQDNKEIKVITQTDTQEEIKEEIKEEESNFLDVFDKM